MKNTCTLPAVSICIPAYDMGGAGVAFLKQALQTIESQTLQNLEVVVADQSDGIQLEQLCANFTGLAIRHIVTANLKRQASANSNAAIRAARGDVVKILFQDDFFAVPTAVEQIAVRFENKDVDWCLCGSEHTRDGTALIRPFVPRLHDQIHFGKNTVSSPSVLAIRRDKALEFDENLTWLMDVDYYRRCHLAYGEPDILPEPLIVNRLHDKQVSAKVGPALMRRELRYIREKYRAQMGWGDWFHYVSRLRKTYL